ncbi:MAG: methionine aminotransferase [Salibacter sp.]|uniref:methionine aminotransferase n=1 Tax=Salibacter sp. TaxID=2010995 RepID=UPI00286FBC0A|nr:methionine aminotransferase [Salibacter sp.]MDR9397497.1 methionine aminotransferase [Salibacter sp.]
MKYPESLSSKLPKVSTTIFTVMSQLAKEHNAINLSQGFPDFPVAESLVDKVYEYMKKGFNQYAPMQGEMALREAVAEKMENMYSQPYNPDTEITITAGGTEAIFSAITSLIKEEDEVIIFTPAYDCYAPTVELSGGKAIYFPLRAPNYDIDWNEVKKLITRRTRMIIINTPHNPTGQVLSAGDMQQLERITKDNEIVILSDEVYEHIIFDGYEHQSVARYPKLAERSFIVGSFGKTFHATGWKVGYCAAPENLMKEFRKVHQYNIFAVNRPVQLALADHLKDPSNYLEVSEMYQEKRNVFVSSLRGSRFKINRSAGTYFQLLDYSEITDEKDTDFSVRLTKEHGVASIPVSVFYNNPVHDNMLRFCFAKEEETLKRAAEILVKL